jgi:transcriptional regulator with XRE-family HTH domain
MRMSAERGKSRMAEAEISPAMVRGARAVAQWSQEDLAKRAMVSRATLEKFENGKSTPNTNNLRSIRNAFEAAGFRLVYSSPDKLSGLAFPEHWK